MRKTGIEAIYRRPNTSKPAPGHRIYPYPKGKIELFVCDRFIRLETAIWRSS